MAFISVTWRGARRGRRRRNWWMQSEDHVKQGTRRTAWKAESIFLYQIKLNKWWRESSSDDVKRMKQVSKCICRETERRAPATRYESVHLSCESTCDDWWTHLVTYSCVRVFFHQLSLTKHSVKMLHTVSSSPRVSVCVRLSVCVLINFVSSRKQ